MRRRAVTSALIAILSCGVGCNASFPDVPDRPSTLVGLHIQYQSPSPATLAPGALLTLRALLEDSEGLFRDVSSQAVWASSNPGVIQVNGTLIRAIAPGLAEISASHEGARASLSIAVALPVIFPRIDLAPFPDPRVVGNSATGRALLFQSNAISQDVTQLATWTSSNPKVATANTGTVTGVNVGTVEISVSYNGVSTIYRLSISPRSF